VAEDLGLDLGHFLVERFVTRPFPQPDVIAHDTERAQVVIHQTVLLAGHWCGGAIRRILESLKGTRQFPLETDVRWSLLQRLELFAHRVEACRQLLTEVLVVGAHAFVGCAGLLNED
jgi:hypothetical protein